MHEEEQDGIDPGEERDHRGISDHNLDVVPTLIVDSPACHGGHLLACHATGRPNRLTQSCEAGAGATPRVQHLIARL